jgi:hypothetical protein
LFLLLLHGDKNILEISQEMNLSTTDKNKVFFSDFLHWNYR